MTGCSSYLYKMSFQQSADVFFADVAYVNLWHALYNPGYIVCEKKKPKQLPIDVTCI